MALKREAGPSHAANFLDDPPPLGLDFPIYIVKRRGEHILNFDLLCCPYQLVRNLFLPLFSVHEGHVT